MCGDRERHSLAVLLTVANRLEREHAQEISRQTPQHNALANKLVEEASLIRHSIATLEDLRSESES